MNNNEIKSFAKLRVIITGIAIVCVLVFASLMLSLNNKSANAINNTGKFYMHGLSEQISRHFETTMELRLNQVESIVDFVDPQNVVNADETYNELAKISKANGFEYLALLSKEGDIQMLYGSQIVEIVNQPAFLRSLNSGDKKVAMGIDSNGDNVVLFGVSTKYPMNGDRNSTALIVALPVSYIIDTLSLEKDETQTYSFIIRADGSYVVHTENDTHGNYFDRVADLYSNTNDITVDDYVVQIKEAMKNETPYSTEMTIEGELRQLNCVKLKYSEWYLLTFMPYGVLNETISDFRNQSIMMMLIGISVIVAAFLVIFIFYLRNNDRQMKILENARSEAVIAQQKAEKASKAKSEFLSNVSHDIRTPMNAIVGMTAIAASNIDDKDRVISCLGKINTSSKHLLGLINNVLDMSKIESGKMTLSEDLISLRELMESVVDISKPQIRAKNQNFDVIIHDIISENVCCDSIRLNQVIINLLSNAVKYTQDEGTIMVTLYQEPSEKGDDYVCVNLTVKDNGIGMSEELRKNIFESFVREDNDRVRQTEGTGLGMAITKYIIDAMEGTIEVESELGKGSEFKVKVDMKKVTVQDEKMRLPAWKMLVVDDDRKLCESIVCYLEDMGVKADWALDGESAIKMIKQSREFKNDYHFVLLDWKLPSMDGIETSKKINRLFGGEIPVILISAYDCGEIEDEARKAGVKEFISKPIFKSTLFYGLKKHTDDFSVDDDREENYNFEGRRILVAEDNELNWEIVDSLLSEIGFKLEWAEDGKICTEKYLGATYGFYDAILMDIRMPVMNGYEATNVIRSSDRPDAKTIPIIAMTADAFAEDVKKCLKCGMNAHVAKPIDIREIARLLDKFITYGNQSPNT